MRKSCLTCALALLIGACSGGTTPPTPDASSGMDAAAHDASAAPEDAASSDSGSASDDAGSSDAGNASEDAGSSDDAGAEDAGSSSDDAGSAQDAGHGEIPPGECAPGPCPMECFRAVRCVSECGGPVTECGCCSCAPGSVDAITCH